MFGKMEGATQNRRHPLAFPMVLLVHGNFGCDKNESVGL